MLCNGVGAAVAKMFSAVLDPFFLTVNPAVLSPSIQGKLTEAGSLYERVIEIEEKVLGPEHPSLATTLEGRAMLLEFQVRAGTFVEKILWHHEGDNDHERT